MARLAAVLGDKFVGAPRHVLELLLRQRESKAQDTCFLFRFSVFPVSILLPVQRRHDNMVCFSDCG